MDSYRYFVYSIKNLLEQSYTDSKISASHVLYATLMCMNRLRYQRIGKSGSNAYLTVFKVSPIKKTDSKYYFDIADGVYDFEGDKGVKFVQGTPLDDDWDMPVKFQRTDPSELNYLYRSKHLSPAPDNAHFYLVDNRVTLLGVNCASLDIYCGVYSPISVDLNCNVNGNKFSLDDKLPIKRDQREILWRKVMDVMLFGLQVRTSTVIDGKQDDLVRPEGSLVEKEPESQQSKE